MCKLWNNCNVAAHPGLAWHSYPRHSHTPLQHKDKTSSGSFHSLLTNIIHCSLDNFLTYHILQQE